MAAPTDQIRVRLLRDGAEVFPAMFRAVETASGSVLLEMYQFSDDAAGLGFLSRLEAAARRGLEVKVLVDAWGSSRTPDSFWEGLRDAGGEVRRFRPIRRGFLPFRNHRKLLLVDDRTVFLGGLNVGDEYLEGREGRLPWRDYALEVSGEGLTRLRPSFDRMWRRAREPLRHRDFLPGRRPEIDAGTVRFLSTGPEDAGHRVRRVYRQVVHQAAVSIDLAMAYFFPPGRVMRELKRAVRRGVRVRLLFPRESDVPVARWAARGLYGRLMRAGMEVYEYLPGMLHAKIAAADGILVAGSANLDLRSSHLNYELVAVVDDKGIADRFRSQFEELLRDSERVILEQWRRRPFLQKVKERLSYWVVARADIFLGRRELARFLR